MVMGGSSQSDAGQGLEQSRVPGVVQQHRTSRRTVLLGLGTSGVAALGGGWALDEGLLPGQDLLRAALGRNGVGAPIPDVPRGNLVHGSFASPARNGARTGWTICWPHGIEPGTSLPVLLMLHGHASDHRAVFEGLAMDRFLTRATRRGVEPFAIASVDAGRDYYKPARDGSDASRMITEEFVPLLADRGLDTGTLSIGGWSMGGYGSLRIAGLGLLPVRSVGVFAPALHRDEGPDDVLRNPARLRGIPLQISCGRGDPFYAIDADYVAALRAAGVMTEWHTGTGAHSQAFWRTFVPRLLTFTARHLYA
jgi:predicted esterase